MSVTQANAAPVLTSVAAHLYVRDLEAAIDYFTQRLRFTVDFVYGRPPFYAQVRRDQALLALRSIDVDVFNPEIRVKEQLVSASITLATAAETRQLFREFEAAGASFAQALKTEAWHATTFIVRDPDGNLILFAGPEE